MFKRFEDFLLTQMHFILRNIDKPRHDHPTMTRAAVPLLPSPVTEAQYRPWFPVSPAPHTPFSQL